MRGPGLRCRSSRPRLPVTAVVGGQKQGSKQVSCFVCSEMGFTGGCPGVPVIDTPAETMARGDDARVVP